MLKKIRQLLSVVLVLALVVQLVPGQCFVSGTDVFLDSTNNSGIIEVEDANVSSEEVMPAQVVGEDVSRRDEFYKEFVLENGLRLASVYPEAVHFEKDGAWEEIDNTLVSDGKGGYTNRAGAWSVRFPGQLSKSSVISVSRDGHILSFGMAGALRSDGGLVVASIENELGTQAVGGSSTLTTATAQLSTAQIQQVDTSAMKTGLDYPEIVQDKLYSRLSYPAVYSGTSVTYDLSGSRVKESVILSAYDTGLWGYRFTLDTGDMIPVLQEDKTVDLQDAAGETVMHMPAPFLVDDAGEYCYDIDVVLTPSGEGYTLSYYLPRTWLAEADRAWPVVLDPVVQAEVTKSNIQDVTVFQQNGSLAYEENIQIHEGGVLYVGRKPEFGKVRSFLKYNHLPPLTSADMITYASINIASVDPYTDSRVIEAHAVTGTWEQDSLTWSASESLVSSTVADYVSVASNETYHAWDITDIVRGWYEAENTGVMLKALDSVENNTNSSKLTKFFSSNFSEYSNQPYLVILFRNNSGLEGYWDYTTSSAGRAGTGYVNDYTGNLVWVHNDMGFGGNRMPVSISHIYNANDIQKNTKGLGHGWRTNYSQTAYHWNGSTDDLDYYVWEDADGTYHYFLRESAGVYKDEDGLELTLKTTGLGVSGASIGIFDKDGNASYFDSNGRLFRLDNDQQTKSSITITYLEGGSVKINTITDGVGRVYKFVYSGGNLSKIQFLGTGSTALDTVYFFYENNQLTGIQNVDGKRAEFTYSTTNLLTTVKDIDGYQLTYGYNTTEIGRPNRITSISENDDTVSGGSLTLSYGKNQTTFRDQNGNVQVKQFNNWGNTLSVRDNLGRAQYAGFSNNDPRVESGKGNQLTLSSKLQATVVNKILNSSFESAVDWTATSSNVTAANVTGNSYLGNRSMKIITTSAATAGQGASKSYSVVSGKTYTFSAWVKTSSASAYLAISDGITTNTSEVLAKYQNTSWTRMEVSITAASTSLTVKVLTTDAGQFYIDCAQLELSPTASRYNLVQGGDFDNCGSSWGTISKSATSPVAPQLGAMNCKLIGSPTATNRVTQTIPISGSEKDVFVVAGWAQGYSVPLTDGTNREFSIIVEFQGSSTATPHKVRFSPNLHQWQYAAGAVIAEQNYTSIKITLAYDYNANTAYFDGIQLYKEAFGHSYVYDDGNVKSVTDLQMQTTEYKYENNKLTEMTLHDGTKLTYEYDSWGNVIKSTSATGMVYEFTYDTWGNNTSVSIVKDTSKITSSATYTNGDLLSTTTDAVGKITTYGYNAQTGVLEWVQYPEDTADTRTEYTYDNLFRMATASATTDTGLNLNASYTYAEDLLTKIQTPTTAYTFQYGNFGLRSSVKAGDKTLASYAYTTDGRNLLSAMTYGNGDSVSYTYDQWGRVTQDTYNDGETVEYQYDNSGALATVTDSESGITSKYYYDLIDRLCKYEEAGQDYSFILEYAFDDRNQVSQVEQIIDGNQRTIEITYDDDGRVTSHRNTAVTESYTYDQYGRLQRDILTLSGERKLQKGYSYTTPSSTSTTGQVNCISYSTGTTGGFSTAIIYSYDDNGNISQIVNNGNATQFSYDTAGQLIRVNDQQGSGRTWIWTYDNAGNILSRKEYSYSTAETPSTLLDTVSYVYDTGSWGDLLTSFDGQAITYDGIGNPTQIGNRTFTWKHGRELATLTENGVTWTNTYNADGLRISRTNGTLTYKYYYSGGQLVRIAIGNKYIDLSYDASGQPMSLYYSGYQVDNAHYYYVTNLQGDVVAILNDAGTAVVTYTYDAWGNILTVGGSMAATLGVYNPLRYRGYVYDQETSLYYLQSRYYDPDMGRYISADNFVATGQAFQGNNMYAYCGNNPVCRADSTGKAWKEIFAAIKETINSINNALSILSNVLVLSNSNSAWMNSSRVMGRDMADAVGSPLSATKAVTNDNFASVWNSTGSKYVIVHTHGDPDGFYGDDLLFTTFNLNQLQRNTNIQYVLITACSVGGDNSPQYNMGQMISEKIAPDGMVVCSTTIVWGDSSDFMPLYGGYWVAYQNGVQIGINLPAKITMKNVADLWK